MLHIAIPYWPFRTLKPLTPAQVFPWKWPLSPLFLMLLPLVLSEYFFLLSFLGTLEVHVHLSLPTQGGRACLEHRLGSGNFCSILTLKQFLPWAFPEEHCDCATCRGLCGDSCSAPCISAWPHSCLTSSLSPYWMYCHLVLGRADILFWGLFL